MSQYVPDSTITFYNAPTVDTKTGRTMIFNKPAAREAFFADYVISSDVKCTVIKKRIQTLKVSATLASIQNANYLSFINPSYGNKIYYAIILSTDYLNNNVTLVTYAIDWWLTDMFNIQFDSTTSILREGLTNIEWSNLSKNPYEDYIKMRTPEPLACNDETEPLHYVVKGGPVTGYAASVQADGWNLFTMGVDVTSQVTDASTEPFYIVSFVECSTGDDGLMKQIYDNCWPDTSDAYLIVTPYNGYDWYTGSNGGTPSHGIAGYAKAQHRPSAAGQSIASTSQFPLKDTTINRPYFMLGFRKLTQVSALLEKFNDFDATSAVLSVQAMPIYILGEFINYAFDNPASEVLNNTYNRIPFPTRYAGTGSNVLPGGLTKSPKLYRFPFSYPSLEGINNSGHIELQYEKMGALDPTVDNEQTWTGWGFFGVRLDANGRPDYFVVEKHVSITADGIYIGVSPVDYEVRMAEGEGKWNVAQTPTNTVQNRARGRLDKSVFYTEFPQVPYVTDAYYAYLAQQAKGQILNNTEYNRLVQENAFGDIENQGRTAVFSSLMNGLSGLAGGGSAATSYAGAIHGVNQGGNTLYREMASGAAQMGALSSGVQTGTGLVSAGISGAQNARRANETLNEMAMAREIMNGGAEALGNPQVDNTFTRNFANVKGAFVNANYHAGSCGGAINFLRIVEQVGVNLIMRRRDYLYDIAYTKFFQLYGYKTQEFKKPAVHLVLEDDLNDDLAPHFETLEDGENVFYTQTENIHLTGVNNESAAYIENLFNGGVLLRKYTT